MATEATSPNKTTINKVLLQDKPPKPIPLSTDPMGKRKVAGFKRTTDYEGESELGVWTDEKRVEAVTAYIALGKMPKVSVTLLPVHC